MSTPGNAFCVQLLLKEEATTTFYTLLPAYHFWLLTMALFPRCCFNTFNPGLHAIFDNCFQGRPGPPPPRIKAVLLHTLALAPTLILPSCLFKHCSVFENATFSPFQHFPNEDIPSYSIKAMLAISMHYEPALSTDEDFELAFVYCIYI